MSLLRAHRWPSTTVVIVVLAAMGFLGRTTLVSVPLVQERVPARLIVGVLVTTVVLTPLYAVFPELSRTFVREPRLRPMRVVAVLAFAAGAIAAAFGVEAGGDLVVLAELRLVLALLALGLAGVVLVGDYAWLPVVTAGLAAIMVTTAPGNVVTAVLVRTPTSALVGAVLLAAVAYAVWGPRRRR